MKKTIAILGALSPDGKIVARALCSSGQHLLLMDTNGGQLALFREALLADVPKADIDCAECPHEASWEADVVVHVASDVPVDAIAARIRDVVTGKPVIVVSARREDADLMQQLLPFSHVQRTTRAADISSFVLG